MLVVFFKALITFLVVLFVIRLMGKRQLGEMQPFELVITLIIAEVACIPMNDPYIPFYSGIIPIVTLAFLHLIMSFISRKSIVARRLISGRSIIVIDKDGINYENLKKMNLNINDLIEAVRSSGYNDLAEIQYAIFETNGKLCVVEKAADPTKITPALLPITLFVDGTWEEKNLTLAGVTKDDIEKELEKNGGLKFKDILYIDIRQNGDTFISPKYAPSFSAELNITGGQNW